MPNKECLSDASVDAQLAAGATDSLAHLEGAVIVAEEKENRTYGCAIAGCDYQCAVVVSDHFPVRRVAVSGICRLALQDMAGGGRTDPLAGA